MQFSPAVIILASLAYLSMPANAVKCQYSRAHQGLDGYIVIAPSVGTAADSSLMCTLSRGDKGKAVEILQTQLNRCGVNVGKVDGDYGAKTENSIKAAQRGAQGWSNIKVDGIYGPDTRRIAMMWNPVTEPENNCWYWGML